ncbi:type II secretion system protein GspM [Achromobacter aloeverae]|nr:type II secretion system protein GspM [Achromobacter aloeverae]
MKRPDLGARAAAWSARARQGLRPLAAWHAALTSRERRLVHAGGAALALYLVFTVAIDPAWTAIARARNELPALRAQAATVTSLANEALRLRQRGGRASNTPLAPADIDASLRRAGLAPDSWRTTQEGGAAGKPASWRIDVKEASSSALMRWSDTVAADLRLRVASAELTRASTEYGRPIPGKVDGMLRLAAATDR